MKFLFSIVFIVISFTQAAFAGQSAELTCIQTERQNEVDVCVLEQLIVDITADGDTGGYGEFMVYMSFTDNSYGYWSIGSGWQSGNATTDRQNLPASGIYESLPSGIRFIVYEGTPTGLCDFAGNRNFSIYAGHAVLTEEKSKQIGIIAKKFPEMAQNLEVAFFKKSMRENGNVSNVFEHTCVVTHNYE